MSQPVSDSNLNRRARGLRQIRSDWPVIVVLVLLGVLLSPIFMQLARPLHNIFFPFQLDAEEGFLLNQALSLRAGLSIYPNLQKPPYLVGNYPPVYPLLYALFVHARDAFYNLPIGRGLALAGALISAICIALGAARVSRVVWAGVLAPMLWFAAWEVQIWLPFARVDFPALAFTLIGFLCFVSARTRRGYVLSGLIFVLAFYTKQTEILAPLACAWALLRARAWDRLRWFAIPSLLLAIFVYSALELMTHGEFFHHTVTYNRNQMDWVGWQRLLKNEVLALHRGLLRTALLLLCASASLWVERRLISSPRRFTIPSIRIRALNTYALLAFASIATMAKVGAAQNYMLEPLAAGVLWIGVHLGLLWRAQRFSPPSTARVALLWLCIAGASLLGHGWYLRAIERIYHFGAWSREDADVGIAMVKLISQSGQRVLHEEPIFELFAGQKPVFQPFIMSRLAREGHWDERPWLKQMVRDYDMLIVTEDLSSTTATYERYSPAMARTIRENYSMNPVSLPVPFLFRHYYLWERREAGH